jgi:small subunit ribosomal protein S2
VILFVGTKKQTQDPVAEFATACGMPYVNQRWLGGMLTNFQTVAGRVRKLVELEASRAAGDFAAMPKKEALSHERELEKLDRNLGGLRRLDRPPDAIFVIDTKKEHIAVTEANKLRLPVVAVVDTNCDPDVIDYVIPGNDDAIRAGRLMCRIIADAVAEGRYIAARRSEDAINSARRTSSAPVAEPTRAKAASEHGAPPGFSGQAALTSEDAAAETPAHETPATAPEASEPAAHEEPEVAAPEAAEASEPEAAEAAAREGAPEAAPAESEATEAATVEAAADSASGEGEVGTAGPGQGAGPTAEEVGDSGDKNETED